MSILWIFVDGVLIMPPRNHRLSGKAMVMGRNRCAASDVTQVKYCFGMYIKVYGSIIIEYIVLLK